jgi:predicted nucleotidyltransferase component of viral defense system
MIRLELLKTYFPPFLWEKQNLRKYLIKEYLQLLMLDYLATTPFIKKVVFIGGTNLRLVKGIDRFSEDLDFDCRDLSDNEFFKMTDSIILFLQRNGLRVETRDKPNDKLKAFRRNIYFPELLFELGLSGYREERFLIKIESQDQNICYEKKLTTIKGCGFYLKFTVPADEILCAMKVSDLLSRQKGRDFYDVMFLMNQTKPDFSFLSDKCGIRDMSGLKKVFGEILKKVDLTHKTRDFEHLVFEKKNARKILLFEDFVRDL